MSDAPKDVPSQQAPNAALIGCADLFADLRGLLRELDELSYEMLEHPKADALCGLIEKLQQWGCRASKHDWQYDQCGYWQHQYCIECGAAKYPDLARRSCGDLTAQMGKMSEAEFLSANDTSPASDGSAGRSRLIRRLRNHISMMAPHQKERQTGKLLIEATECLEMCERVIEKQLFSNPPNAAHERPATSDNR